MPEVVAPQFDDAVQQHEAATLGMWTFLATEVLFFGGLFTGYTVYRIQYAEAFREASGHLYMWIGVVNTAVLLMSSLAMAVAVHMAKLGRAGLMRWSLLATAGLGLVFMGFKGYEYSLDWHDEIVPAIRFATEHFSQPNHAELFFIFYWIMTMIHALHLTIGIGMVLVLVIRSRFTQGEWPSANTIEMAGLYWHFVDIVWIFLLPLLYLVGVAGS